MTFNLYVIVQIMVSNTVILVSMCFLLIFLDARGKGRKGVDSDLISVRAKRDGNVYSVLKGANQHEAARTLSIITDFASDVVNYMIDNYPLDKRVVLLHQRLNKTPLRFEQFQPPTGAPVAVAHDKGKGGVQLCLYDAHGVANKLPALKSIVLHELSHLTELEESPMVDGFSQHDNCFKATERMFTSVAHKFGLIPVFGAIDYPYCGITIPDPGTVV